MKPSLTADSTAESAVWPRPQIDASRATTPMSASSLSSVATEPMGAPPASRATSSSWRTVPTRHGTHWPQDSSRKNWVIRRSNPGTDTVSSRTSTTPEPSVAPAARTPSKVSGMSRNRQGPTNTAGRACSSSYRPQLAVAGRTPPAPSITSPSVTPNSYSYRPGACTQPDRQNSRVPVDAGVPTAA